MDLILTAYAEAELEGMSHEALDLYDALLNENDQDLYTWVTGQVTAPDRYKKMIDKIAFSLQRN